MKDHNERPGQRTRAEVSIFQHAIRPCSISTHENPINNLPGLQESDFSILSARQIVTGLDIHEPGLGTLLPPFWLFPDAPGPSYGGVWTLKSLWF